MSKDGTEISACLNKAYHRFGFDGLAKEVLFGQRVPCVTVDTVDRSLLDLALERFIEHEEVASGSRGALQIGKEADR